MQAKAAVALSATGTLSATAEQAGFTPTSEENTARTNQAVQVGATEWKVILIGGGGGGGAGRAASSGARFGDSAWV